MIKVEHLLAMRCPEILDNNVGLYRVSFNTNIAERLTDIWEWTYRTTQEVIVDYNQGVLKDLNLRRTTDFFYQQHFNGSMWEPNTITNQGLAVSDILLVGHDALLEFKLVFGPFAEHRQIQFIHQLVWGWNYQAKRPQPEWETIFDLRNR